MSREVRRQRPLLPPEIRASLPPLYSQEALGLEALALVKFVTPDSSWNWFASEYDQDDTFFSLVSGLEVELGYWSLSELESVTGPLGLPIERDESFTPKTLRALMALHEGRGGDGDPQ